MHVLIGRSDTLKQWSAPLAAKGLIFDLDGVLVDTVPTHFEAWSQMFHEYGYDFDQRIYRDHVDGKLRQDGARAVMVNHSEAEIVAASDRKNEYYLERIRAGQFVVFDAAAKYVRQCKQRPQDRCRFEQCQCSVHSRTGWNH